MGESSPSKRFKLDKALDETTDDDIATQALFRAYRRGELSTSILSRDETPLTSTASTTAQPSSSSYRQPNRQASSATHAQTSNSDNPSASQQSLPGDNKGSTVQPSLPISPSKRSNTSLLVNARQRGNPVLKFIRNVAWEFVEMEPDYVMGRNTCALFLSLRYHNFNPNYIHGRIEKLGRAFELRILLAQVDVTDPHTPLKELTRVSILSNMTLMLAWSAEEAGRYLESYKALENKPADLIKEKVNKSFLPLAEDFLTSIRSVNKTDTATLLAHFGSMEAIMKAEVEELSACPGLGLQKAKRIYEIFRTPFPRAVR